MDLKISVKLWKGSVHCLVPLSAFLLELFFSEDYAHCASNGQTIDCDFGTSSTQGGNG